MVDTISETSVTQLSQILRNKTKSFEIDWKSMVMIPSFVQKLCFVSENFHLYSEKICIS